MTQIEELERRIFIKKQLIEWTEEDIKELEKKIAELDITVGQTPVSETPDGGYHE